MSICRCPGGAPAPRNAAQQIRTAQRASRPLGKQEIARQLAGRRSRVSEIGRRRRKDRRRSGQNRRRAAGETRDGIAILRAPCRPDHFFSARDSAEAEAPPSNRRRRRADTRPRAAVGEGLAGDRYELPVVAGRVKSQLEHSVRHAVPHRAVRFDDVERPQRRAAGADDEFLDAIRIEDAIRILPMELLVIVIVAADDDVGARVVERLKKVAHHRMIAVRSRAEVRVVPVREGAQRAVCGQIGAQPLFLHGADSNREVAVERDDVPRADVVAVVPAITGPGKRAEEREIRRRGR